MNTGVIQRKVQTGSVSDPAIGQCQARVVVHEGRQGGVTAVVMTLAAMVTIRRVFTVDHPFGEAFTMVLLLLQRTERGFKVVHHDRRPLYRKQHQ